MKKIFLLSVLLSQLVIAFGQTVGQIVKSKTIFSSLGVTVSYTVTYYGIIDCNNNTATGHKKYRLNFNAQNNSSSTVRLVASRIDLDDNLDRFKSNCYSSDAILLGSYPGFEQFGTLIPGENVNATKYVYMDQRSADLPYVTYNFIASTVPNKNQTPANSQAQLNTNNPRSNNNQPKQNSSLNTTNSNSTNTSNGEQSITDINEEIRDLQRRQNVACSKLQQQGQPYNSRLCAEGFNGGLAQTDADSRKWVVQLRSQVRELESATNTSSGNTNTQQNDLTEYNRSKAEMERQIDEKNAKSRQDFDNAYQSYKQAFEAGVGAYNSNNYTEAQRQFQSAMNASTTEEQRRSAKDGYDKAVNAPKRQATGELVKVGINALEQIFRRDTYEEKEEKSRLREEKEEREARKKADLEERKRNEYAEQQNIYSQKTQKAREGILNNDAKSFEILGKGFQYGKRWSNLEINFDSAIYYFKNAIQLGLDEPYRNAHDEGLYGNIIACYKELNNMDKVHEYEETVFLKLKELAIKNDSAAMFHYYFQLFKKGDAEWKYWLEKSAKLEFLPAMDHLATNFFKGEDSYMKDEKKAEQILVRACEIAKSTSNTQAHMYCTRLNFLNYQKKYKR